MQHCTQELQQVHSAMQIEEYFAPNHIKILAAGTFKGDSPSTSIVDAESFQRKFNSFQFPSKTKAII